jgi:hypothetical protein
MNSKKSFSVCIKRTLLADSAPIFNLFKDGTIFKLTGANTIQYDFNVNGDFLLIFENRGRIYGRFLTIKANNINMEWNVEGFQRQVELMTTVDVSIFGNNSECTFTLNHLNIFHEDSAASKRRAWTEILDKVEQLL